jgi:4-hydroxy-3-methylbut-2-enyl diphosphate reductase IspH
LSAQNSIGVIENIHNQEVSNELQRQLLDEIQNQPKNSQVVMHRSFGITLLIKQQKYYKRY